MPDRTDWRDPAPTARCAVCGKRLPFQVGPDLAKLAAQLPPKQMLPFRVRCCSGWRIVRAVDARGVHPTTANDIRVHVANGNTASGSLSKLLTPDGEPDA